MKPEAIERLFAEFSSMHKRSGLELGDFQDGITKIVGKPPTDMVGWFAGAWLLTSINSEPEEMGEDFFENHAKAAHVPDKSDTEGWDWGQAPSPSTPEEPSSEVGDDWDFVDKSEPAKNERDVLE